MLYTILRKVTIDGKIIIIDVDDIDFVENKEDLNKIISKVDKAIIN